MLCLPIFLSLFWVCLGLDLNGGLTKKYAFMKIMSGCLGEDFVMMVKEQMMKACAECHGRDMNDTQHYNLDYLMNSFRASQQHIPITPSSQINPTYVYQPIVHPIFLQIPYSSSPFPQFPAQHLHGQQQDNTFSHHSHNLPTIPHGHHASAFQQFPAQHQLQHSTFSRHTSLPTGHHPFNIPSSPNIPHGHQAAVAPQYSLTKHQNDLIKFDEHKPINIDQFSIDNQHPTHDDSHDPLFRSPVPNNQLGYPDSVHHESQFFDIKSERQLYELNPQPVVEAQKRRKRSLPLSPENLETLKNNLSIKIGNMTCVFREMGWLTEENDVNFTFIEQQIKNLDLNMKLREDLIYSHETCKDFSMCLPSDKSKHPLMREMGGALSYMKCMNTKAVTACMKHDFRMYQAKMGFGSSDMGGLPMEMVNLLGQENTDPSQLADDIGSLVFADDAQLPL